MKNTLHGYMTIEAALLMPMVWFALFFMIFAGFFQYDRCIAEQDSKIIVLRASDMRKKEEAKVIQKVLDKGELAGKKRLLFSNPVQREFHISKDRAIMKIRGKVNTVLNNLIKESALTVFEYAAEYEAENFEPVSFIRMCRRIENYAGS